MNAVVHVRYKLCISSQHSTNFIMCCHCLRIWSQSQRPESDDASAWGSGSSCNN